MSWTSYLSTAGEQSSDHIYFHIQELQITQSSQDKLSVSRRAGHHAHAQVNRFPNLSQSRGTDSRDQGTFFGSDSSVLSKSPSNEPPISQGAEGEKRVINALLLCSMPDTLCFPQP